MGRIQKRLQSLLAMLLAVIMVLSNTNYAIAADNVPEGQPEAVQEAATETDESVDEKVETETKEIETEQEAEPAATPAAEPTNREETTAYPAFQTQNVFEDETVVIISAKEGVLPEGTTAEIKELDYEEDLQDVLDTALLEKSASSVDAKMVDVVLKDKAGNVIQPKGNVEISISKMKLDVPEDYKDLVSYNAYRINADESLSLLKENVDITKDEVKFENDHFTAVGIVAEAETSKMEDEAMVTALRYNLSNISSQRYCGYKDESLLSKTEKTSYKYPLYVQDGGERIAYCFNETKAWPGVDSTQDSLLNKYGMYYRKVENANALDMNELTAYNDSNMRTKVLRTVYNGYPYNAAGIKEKYGLNNMQYRAVTQAAIWYYTDRDTFITKWKSNLYTNGIIGDLCGTYNVSTGYYIHDYFTWNDNMTSAFFALSQNADSSGLENPPSNFELDLYVTEKDLDPSLFPSYTSNNQEIVWQTLLSTKVLKDTTPPPPPTIESDNASITIRAKKTLNDAAPGEDYTFTFGLWKGTTATGNPIQTATNDAEGNVIFARIDNVKDGDKFVIKEIAGNDSSITYDETEKVITVSLKAVGTEYIENANVIEGYQAADGSLHMTVDGNDLRVYCIYQNKPGHDGAFTPTINPNDEQLKENTQGGVEYGWTTYNVVGVGKKSVAEVLRKVLYYFSQHEGEYVNGKLNYDGTYDQILLNESMKQTMIWGITGGSAGTTSIATAIGNIYKAATTVPDEFKVVMFASNNNKQPVITGFMPGKIAITTYEDGADTPTFNNTTKVSVNVNKVWNDNYNQDGKRPNSVTVRLLADGRYTGITKQLNEGTNWRAEFDNLDEYQNGKKVVYSVSENDVEFYTAEITQTDLDGKHFKITNTHTPEVIRVAGTKSWKDNNDQDGKRPESVEVILKKGGQELARQTVSAATDWKYVFTNLPKYENNGAEIRYTVQEGAVPTGYQSSVTGHDITNTYTPGKVAVQVAKSWIDNDNQDNIRPTSVTVHLYANGTDTGKKLILSADNNWIGEFSDLDEKAAGKVIKYTISEDAVKGYTTTITQGADEKHFTVTNTHTSELTKVEGTKSWDDKNDKAGLRPDSVVIILKKGGQELERKTVTKEDDWKYSFKNLPKYERGVEIRYSVEEANVPEGYQSSIDGYDIKNSYTPGKIAVQVAKSWQDDRNLEGVRPASIRVWLYENGVETKKYVDLNEKNNWTANFSDLDEMKNGKKVEYTVREEAVKEYETTYEVSQGGKHVTITNTHTSERVKVSVEKQWDDKDNAYECRPSHVKLTLYQEYEGELYPVTYAYVSEAEGWKYTFDNLPKYVYDFENNTFVYDKNGNKEVVKYTVREHADDLPEGYVADPEVVENAENDYTIINKVNVQDVTISKTDITGSEELEGAELVVKDLTGKTIEEWTSKADGGHNVTVQPGIYVLSETTAPKGYKVTESIMFKVDELGKTTIVKQTEEDGEVSYEEVETVDKVVMKDDYEDGKVIISKTDVAGNELEGAKLEITDKDGKVVEKWTSEAGKNKEVELYPGTYTLTEKTAPKGYEIAESITFTVDKDSKVTVDDKEVGKVAMVDEYSEHTVKFSKTDLKGKELKGAEIKLTDKDGNVIEKWKSEGKVKEFSLKPGTYTFTETAAPKGYKIASAITFEVGINGKITSKDVELKGSDKNLIVMVDDYAKKTTPKKTQGNNSVRTGDSANVVIWIILILASLATVFTIIRKKFFHK